MGRILAVALAMCAVVMVRLPREVTTQEVTPRRGLWVWDSVLHDAKEQHAFLDFCQRHHIAVVWMQVKTLGTGKDRRLDSAVDWEGLVAAAHRQGMKVAALDGDPHYVLPAQHEIVLSIVDAVVAYNASARPSERFDGIHLDIEPHVLPEWKDRTRREQLLTAYLDVTATAVARARVGGVPYAVDVPYWWSVAVSETGEPASTTTFRGVRQSATDHLLEIVDIIGIM